MDLLNATSILMKTAWIEQPAIGSFRIWHVMFICFAVVLSLVIIVCCCIKIRIPRTKQEIEADYQRKKIVRKFQKQLKLINNQEMDNMDLKKALATIQKEIFNWEAASEIDAQLSSSLNSVPADINIISSDIPKQECGTMEAEPQQPVLNRTFSQKVAALVKLSKLKPLPPVEDETLTPDF